MLLDVNVLIYAIDRAARQHRAVREWLTRALDGSILVGLPWPTLVGFLRITTNPRATPQPLAVREAWAFVEDWLRSPVVWIPGAGARHAAILQDLITRYDLRGNLVSDAHLAALAVEHGLSIVSADSDFARFREVRWINPVG